MWLEVGEIEDCMWTQCVRSQNMAGGRKDRGLYGGGRRQCVRSRDVAGGRGDRG